MPSKVKTAKKPVGLAVIFDMDGVVVDNTKYHILTWQKFAKDSGRPISSQTVREEFMGRFSREIMKEFFHIDVKQVEKLDRLREAYYRRIYAKAIKPVKGLEFFLESLRKNKIRIALATSAPPINVKWVLQKTRLKKYFPIIVDSSGVKRGKPNPDIFLKAAKNLKINKNNCVVFEDTFHGIQAAKRAGMKVVAVATSHSLSELTHADLTIRDFTKLTLSKLKRLF